MVMSELGSVLGGVSLVGNQRGDVNRVETNRVPPAYGYHASTAAAAEIQQIKSSEEEIYEDDSNVSQDASMPEDCASFMNSELGISAGDVSAILFGGRSANYQSSTSEGYVNGLFGSNQVSSGYDSNVNTSQDDTIGDLFARDDTSVMDSIIGPSLENHLQIGKSKKIGPLGDELSYAQDDSTAPPVVPAVEKSGPIGPELHLDMDVIMNDEALENDEEEQRGILPVWLSTSNSRTKSLLVVSAALIVGSLVMAIVALGANSQWFGTDEPNGAGPSLISSEANEDFRGITVVPSLKPSEKPSKKPTRLPTLAPVPTVSDETGESFVDVAATEATTTTEATEQTTTVVTTIAQATTSEITTQFVSTEGTTAMATNAPTESIAPSTLAPIETPTISPSYAPYDSPSFPPSRKPITLSPTLSKCNAVTFLLVFTIILSNAMVAFFLFFSC